MHEIINDFLQVALLMNLMICFVVVFCSRAGCQCVSYINAPHINLGVVVQNMY